MQDNNRNLILATVLSFLVILVWYTVFAPEPPVAQQRVHGGMAGGTGHAVILPPRKVARGAQSGVERVGVLHEGRIGWGLGKALHGGRLGAWRWSLQARLC